MHTTAIYSTPTAQNNIIPGGIFGLSRVLLGIGLLQMLFGVFVVITLLHPVFGESPENDLATNVVIAVPTFVFMAGAVF